MKEIVRVLWVIGFVSVAQAEPPISSSDNKAASLDDTIKVRVFEEAPPKAVGMLPPGWKLVVIKDHKIKHPPIELPGGKQTVVTTAAYAVVPDGGVEISEPGYDASKAGLGRFTATIGAVLARNAEDAESASTALKAAEESLKAAIPETGKNDDNSSAKAARKRQAAKKTEKQ